MQMPSVLPTAPTPVNGGTPLPTFSKDPLAALASLSTCYINLERGCDFHRDERSRQYLQAWRRTAPAWCLGGGSSRDQGVVADPPPRPILRDRLGVPASVYR